MISALLSYFTNFIYWPSPAQARAGAFIYFLCYCLEGQGDMLNGLNVE